MAERDRFELDLAAALRTYLGDAPTEVRPTELAHQFAATYPHGRTALARWGFGRTRAMASRIRLSLSGTFTNSTSAPARSGVAGRTSSRSNCTLRRRASAMDASLNST